MTALVAIVLGVVAVAAVLSPLVRGAAFSRQHGRARGRDGASVQELLDQRETLLKAMAELEYDRRLGKLAEDEHRRLRADYEVQAVAVLKLLDERGQGLDEVIDRDVYLRRSSKASAPVSSPEREPAEPSGPPIEASTGQAAGRGHG